jgi:anti-anti-sigma factor
MKLSGMLDFAAVQKLLTQGATPPADGRLDLHSVERIDSAGLSFLLEMTRRAGVKGQQLRIVGAGEQPRALAHFFGLQEILKFDA